MQSIYKIKIISYALVLVCLGALFYSCTGTPSSRKRAIAIRVKERRKKLRKAQKTIQMKKEIAKKRIEEEGLLKKRTVGGKIKEESVEEIIAGKDEVKEDGIIEKDGYRYFDSAETLFQDSQLTDALSFYKFFLERFEDNEYTDDAIYRIGQIYFYLRDYPSSLTFFTALLERFPSSDWHREAEYSAGLCYFFTGDYTSAIDIFEKILPERTDKKRLGEIHYFNGKSYYRKADFNTAIKEFKKAIELSDDENVKKFSYETIKDIIENKMKREGLEGVVAEYNYLKEFPLDISLYKLAYYYSKQKDYNAVKESFENLLYEFPVFEYKEEVENWLKGLTAASYSHEIKIGCILPLSGSAASTGERILRGIRLALNSFLNEIDGYELQLVILDSEGNPEKAAAAARELGMIDNVMAIVGPVFSKSAFSVAKVADEMRIPVFTPTASADGLPETSKYMFRNCMTSKLQGRAIAEYAFNTLHLKRFVVFYPDNRYGIRLKEIFTNNIKKLGGEIVADQSYNPSANDFGKEIKNIGGMDDDEIKKMVKKNYRNRLNGKTSVVAETGLSFPVIDEGIDPILNIDYIKPSLKLNYDAIFIPGYFDKVGLIVPELSFYNISPMKLIGANGWNSIDLLKIGGKYVVGSTFVDGFFINSSNPVVSDFVTTYRKTFQEDPDILTAQAYDAMKIIGEAMKNGHITREGIREYLSKEVNGYPGVSGVTHILPSGESEKDLYLLEVKREGIRQIN